MQMLLKVEIGVEIPGREPENSVQLEADRDRAHRFLVAKLEEILSGHFCGSIAYTHEGVKIIPRFQEIFDHSAELGEVERDLLAELQAAELAKLDTVCC